MTKPREPWSPTDLYPDYFDHNEWDPSWDYKIDERPYPKTVTIVRKQLRAIASYIRRLKIRRFYVFYVKGTGTLGRYISGTAENPVLVLNLPEIMCGARDIAAGEGGALWREVAVAIEETLLHEFNHAYLERAGVRTDEVDHDEDLVEDAAITAHEGLYGKAKAMLDSYAKRVIG